MDFLKLPEAGASGSGEERCAALWAGLGAGHRAYGLKIWTANLCPSLMYIPFVFLNFH